MTEPAAHHDAGHHDVHTPPPPIPEEEQGTVNEAPKEEAAPTPEKKKPKVEVDLKTFKIGDRVFYFQNGEWKTGRLNIPPVKKRGVIVMTVGGEEVRLEVAPHRVEFPLATAITAEGKEYTIKKVYPGKNGEPLYDLVTADPADSKHGVDQETVKNWKETGEKRASLEQQVAVNKEMAEREVERILDEVKDLKGSASLGILKPLKQLEQDVEEMKAILEKAGEDAAQLKEAEKNIKSLERKTEKALKAMDKDIEVGQKAKEKIEAGEEKRKAAGIVDKIFAKEAEKGDKPKRLEHENALREWTKKTNAYTNWKNEIEALVKKVGSEKSGEDFDKLKQLKDNPEPKPGNKPELEIPSRQESVKEELYARVYAEIERIKGTANPELVQLSEEIDKRRKAEAKAMGQDDFATDPEKNSVNIKELEKLAREWGVIPEKVEEIDIPAQKTELEQKAEELENKAHELDKDDIGQEIKTIVAEIKTATASEQIIDLWHNLGTIEIKLARVASAEKKESGVEHAEHEGVMDLPQNIVEEMLLADPEGIEAAMKEAYAVLYTPERNQTKLENILRKFFRNINIDAGEEKQLTLRQRLQKEGIQDWESYVKKFEGQMAKNLADVLLQATGTEFQTFLSQHIGDIKRLAEEKKISWYNLLAHLSDLKEEIAYSSVWKMKGVMGVRLLVNSLLGFGLVGGSAVATGVAVNLVPFLPGPAKAAAVGGVVGFMKGITQRLMGKDKGQFQEKAKSAKTAAEVDKKKLIADSLLKRMFRKEADGSTAITRANELSHFLAASIRRASEGGGKFEVKDSSGQVVVVLKGDAVCMYHEALKRAAETEGLEVEEKTRLEFARALHTLHNNEAVENVDVPPLLMRGLKWFIDAYTGHEAVPEGKPADVVQVGRTRQLAITSMLGATVAAAATADSSIVRTIIGSAFGLMRGQKAQLAAERRIGDQQSRENFEKIIDEVTTLVKKADQASAFDLALVKDYRDLLAAFLTAGNKQDEEAKKDEGKKIVFPEGAAINSLEKNKTRNVRWLIENSPDVVRFLRRDAKMRTTLESVQREIARSGFLERQNTELRNSFEDSLTSMQKASERLHNKVERTSIDKVKRFMARGGWWRVPLYTGIGAGISWGIGKGALALKKHFAPPAAETAPTHHEAVPTPVVHHEAAAAPPAAEFPTGSEVHQGEGITDPLARQLVDKFKVDIAHNQRPTITLENGHSYEFHGNIHSARALTNFADKMSAEMAKLKGDINLKAGTEHRLENVGGHVVLEEKNGRLGYTITDEKQYTHGIDWRHETATQGKPEPAAMTPEEKGWVPLKNIPDTGKWEPLYHGGTSTTGVDISHLHLTGKTPLADQLHNPMADAGTHKIDLLAGVKSAPAPAVSGVDQAMMHAMQEQIAAQTNFHDWAMSDPNIQHYVAAGLINKDQLEGMIQDWDKHHPAPTLGSSHDEFFRSVKYHAVTETSAQPTIVTKTPAPAPGGATNTTEAAHAATAAGQVEAGTTAISVSADHPVAIEVRDNNQIVHFFDQTDHHDHAAVISNILSPALSGDKHNPLSIKLTASGRPVPARLEMHSIPGKLDKEPVIVVEDETFNEEVLYRIADGKLQEIVAPPPS